MAKKKKQTSARIVGLCRTPEYGADDHMVYVATITPEILDKVEAAQKALAGIEDAFCVEVWDYSILVYSKVPDEKDLIPQDDDVVEALETQNEDGEVFDGDKDQVRIDCPMIKIMDGCFCWTWYPKHSGNSGECSTETFVVEDCRAVLRGLK